MYLNGDEWPFLTLFLYGWVYDEAAGSANIDEAARRFAALAPSSEVEQLSTEIARINDRLAENWVSLGWTANRSFGSEAEAGAWLARLQSGLQTTVPAQNTITLR